MLRFYYVGQICASVRKLSKELEKCSTCATGRFNTGPCCNVSSQPSMCPVPRWSMHKNVIFVLFSNKPYFYHKKCEENPNSYWRLLRTVKFRPIKSRVNSLLKIAKLFQFQNSVFPTVFEGCTLLSATTIDT